MLTTGNQHAVEMAASTYSLWRKLLKRSQSNLEDLGLIRAVAKARNDYVKILTDLGLVKPKKVSQGTSKVEPLSIATDDPDDSYVEGTVLRRKLLIEKLPDVDDQATTG